MLTVAVSLGEESYVFIQAYRGHGEREKINGFQVGLREQQLGLVWIMRI